MRLRGVNELEDASFCEFTLTNPAGENASGALERFSGTRAVRKSRLIDLERDAWATLSRGIKAGGGGAGEGATGGSALKDFLGVEIGVDERACEMRAVTTHHCQGQKNYKLDFRLEKRSRGLVEYKTEKT